MPLPFRKVFRNRSMRRVILPFTFGLALIAAVFLTSVV